MTESFFIFAFVSRVFVGEEGKKSGKMDRMGVEGRGEKNKKGNRKKNHSLPPLPRSQHFALKNLNVDKHAFREKLNRKVGKGEIS